MSSEAEEPTVRWWTTTIQRSAQLTFRSRRWWLLMLERPKPQLWGAKFKTRCMWLIYRFPQSHHSFSLMSLLSSKTLTYSEEPARNFLLKPINKKVMKWILRSLGISCTSSDSDLICKLQIKNPKNLDPTPSVLRITRCATLKWLGITKTKLSSKSTLRDKQRPYLMMTTSRLSLNNNAERLK